MSKRNGRARPAAGSRQAFVKQQAKVAQARKSKEIAVDADKMTAAKAIQEMLMAIAKLNQRVKRLADFSADRCARIVELKAELYAEWERANTAEAQVADLEARNKQLREQVAKPAKKAAAPRNGRAKTTTQN